jgi:sugar phosphate permease
VLTLSETTPVIGVILVGAALGLPMAFNNLALQATVYAEAPQGHTGVAAGLFQTCRYLGAIMSTALLGLAFEQEVSTAGLHTVAVIMAGLAVILTVVAYGAGSSAGRRGAEPSAMRGGRHRA